MQIEVRPGKLYFLKGKEGGRAIELVAGLRTARYRVLVVSSRATGAVKDDMDVPINSILTLTESVGANSMDPQNLMVLTDTMTKFIEHGGPSVLLIENLGLLKQKNEFPKVLQMIGYIYESVAMNRAIGLVVIDPQAWDDKELAFLGKEGSMVEEKDRLELRSLQSRNLQNHPTQNL